MAQLEKGPIPLWYQLEGLLKAQIRNREILPGELLPTEMELCKRYGISRATVRQAIKSLEDNGLIKREQGRGTKVLSQEQRQRHVKLYGSIQDLQAMGSETHLQFISRKLVSPGSELVKDGNLKIDEKVYLYEAKRVVKKPIEFFAIVHFYIPRHLGAKMTLQQVKESTALIEQVEKIGGAASYRIEQSIQAAAADDKMANQLEIDVGAPVLKIKRVYLDNDNNLLQSAISYVANLQYEFKTEMFMTNQD